MKSVQQMIDFLEVRFLEKKRIKNGQIVDSSTNAKQYPALKRVKHCFSRTYLKKLNLDKYMLLILELVYVHLSHDQSIYFQCSNILELSISSPLSSENDI
ncbi:hypothetical protein Bache_2539 [Bacteroides helcogenes P 36-108]|uniref:Uncharacterized protein n=1 Tax=Bacteroides helcogenes (strain ATCC 35417 / DSM 20613 / JCM 6297 / CCUG 15421 / P 36-108) TaxID=693979 RepID=E6SVD4_BACT6|nr:hypothetical protein Bache_2539 [Bacteroides helcogenes P 36-108]